MELVLISGLSAACVLTAVEGLIRPLGKFRGLAALLLSIASVAILEAPLRYATPIVLAATFVGLTLSIVVEQLFVGTITPRQLRDLPNRVDRL